MDLPHVPDHVTMVVWETLDQRDTDMPTDTKRTGVQTVFVARRRRWP